MPVKNIVVICFSFFNSLCLNNSLKKAVPLRAGRLLLVAIIFYRVSTLCRMSLLYS